MIIKKINEAIEKNPIDIKKLVEYSKAIEIICNGEYGEVFYNENENHIFVCLGDANPFDLESLEEFIKDAVSKDWESAKLIKVTIEDECYPDGEGWKKIKS
jgi:hypothetical protein